jgi:hypothetical protein
MPAIRAALLASLVLAALSLPILASAADLYVPTTVYPTIQAAVNVAGGGDTVHIDAGTYAETVSITETGGFALVGAGAGATLVTGNTAAGGAVVLIDTPAGSVTVSNLAIRNDGLGDGMQVGSGFQSTAAVLTNVAIDEGGGDGLYVAGAGQVTASDCSFSRNAGLGVYLWADYAQWPVVDPGPVALHRCDISGNVGANVYCVSYGTVTLDSCTITDAQRDPTGTHWPLPPTKDWSIGVYSGSRLSMADCRVARNDFGAFSVGPTEVTDCTFEDNGNCGYFSYGGPETTIAGGSFVRNGLTDPWGYYAAVHIMYGSGVSLTGVTLESCANGVVLDHWTSATLDQCRLVDNQWSGVFCAWDCSLSVTNSYLEGNAYCGIWTADPEPDPISGNTITQNPGPGIVCGYLGSNHIDSNIITGNGGPGILVRVQPWPPWPSSDDYVPNPTITGNTLSGNTGGGIVCWDAAPTNAATLDTDNAIDGANGPFRIFQAWYPTVRVVKAGVPVPYAQVRIADTLGDTSDWVAADADGVANSWWLWSQFPDAACGDYAIDNNGDYWSYNPHTFTATDGVLTASVPGNLTGRLGTITIDLLPLPVITSVSASPGTLWPPNKKLVPVTVSAAVTSPAEGPATWEITGVTCNEPITDADYRITDAHTVLLRADRLGTGAGRIYTITVQATNAAGSSAPATVTVTVPHDQRR